MIGILVTWQAEEIGATGQAERIQNGRKYRVHTRLHHDIAKMAGTMFDQGTQTMFGIGGSAGLHGQNGETTIRDLQTATERKFTIESAALVGPGVERGA